MWKRRPSAHKVEQEIVAAGQYTADQWSKDIRTDAKSVFFFIDVTALGGTAPSMNVEVHAKDPVSGNYKMWSLLSGINTTGMKVICIGPGVTDNFGRFDVHDELPVPSVYQVRALCPQPNGDETYTFSIGSVETD